ncbi:MAG: hypothetical protein BGN85_13140 [Alphaproteobacteria bacterium 64-11]|nr:DUF1453 family protein [Alphaproteobacteria bacterium]OJU08071.1 MAG: hypothetical protein BGN85_13140 [Alphaproteobacteria bacterium 64-11]
MPHHGPLAPYAPFLPFLVLVPILYLRMRKMSRPQPLKLHRLWIRPALFILLGALALLAPQRGAYGAPGGHLVIAASAFMPMDWAILAVAAALGAVAGWYWGRTMAIEVHSENGTLMVRGGQAAMLVLVVLILLRMGLRYGAAAEAAAWHLNAVLIADASIVFSVALFCVRSLEMFIRARRVMAAAAR